MCDNWGRTTDLQERFSEPTDQQTNKKDTVDIKKQYCF